MINNVADGCIRVPYTILIFTFLFVILIHLVIKKTERNDEVSEYIQNKEASFRFSL